MRTKEAGCGTVPVLTAPAGSPPRWHGLTTLRRKPRLGYPVLPGADRPRATTGAQGRHRSGARHRPGRPPYRRSPVSLTKRVAEQPSWDEATLVRRSRGAGGVGRPSMAVGTRTSGSAEARITGDDHVSLPKTARILPGTETATQDRRRRSYFACIPWRTISLHPFGASFGSPAGRGTGRRAPGLS